MTYSPYDPPTSKTKVRKCREPGCRTFTTRGLCAKHRAISCGNLLNQPRDAPEPETWRDRHLRELMERLAR